MFAQKFVRQLESVVLLLLGSEGPLNGRMRHNNSRRVQEHIEQNGGNRGVLTNAYLEALAKHDLKLCC